MGQAGGWVCCCKQTNGGELDFSKLDQRTFEVIFSGSEFNGVHLAMSEFPAAKDWMLPAGHKVYHTSVVVNGVEYYFDKDGVQAKKISVAIPPSHANKTSTNVINVGNTNRTGEELIQKLSRFFQPGSYDLICKNCNTFTDCALAYLLSRRLPKMYSSVEAMAKGMPTVLSLASGGRYKANPAAVNFDVEKVVMSIDENAWMGTASAEVHLPTNL